MKSIRQYALNSLILFLLGCALHHFLQQHPRRCRVPSWEIPAHSHHFLILRHVDNGLIHQEAFKRTAAKNTIREADFSAGQTGGLRQHFRANLDFDSCYGGDEGHQRICDCGKETIHGNAAVVQLGRQICREVQRHQPAAFQHVRHLRRCGH